MVILRKKAQLVGERSGYYGVEVCVVHEPTVLLERRSLQA
jgi:hypothetical protein